MNSGRRGGSVAAVRQQWSAFATVERVGSGGTPATRGRATISKYRAVKTVVDGVTFASKREAARYQVLRLRERLKAIAGLELQPVFRLDVVEIYRNGWPIRLAHVGNYIADFRYTDLRSGEIVIEDSKGFRTPTYRLKRKLVEAIHGVIITEV